MERQGQVNSHANVCLTYEYSEFLGWIRHLVNFWVFLFANILLLCLGKIPKICCVKQAGIINRWDYDAMISW